MELVDEYVQAVKQYLPDSAQQNDIARELAENIQSQIDDQAEALGRPLTADEQAAILKRLGSPAVVAGHYQTNPRRLAFGRELIGPVLFPIYLRVLLLNLGLMMLGNLLAAALVGSAGPAVLPTVVANVLVQFVIVTAVFIAAQAHLTRYPDLWDARQPPAAPRPPVTERRVPRTESLAEVLIIVAVVFMLRSFPAVAPAAVVSMGLETVWTLGYWSVYGLALASLVPPVIALICPAWTVFRAWARVALGVLWLGILAVLLVAGPWASGAGPVRDPRALLINRWLPWNIGAVALLSLAIVGYDAWRLVRAARQDP